MRARATTLQVAVALTVCAWIVFVAGLFALGSLDHALRMGDGDVRTGGIGEPLQDLLVGALGCMSAAIAWRGLAGRSAVLRVLLVATQVGLGFVLYAFAAIGYVCGTGIDCL